MLVRHIKSLKADRKPPIFSAHILRNIIRIAIPSTLQQSFVSVGNIAIQSIINGFGTAAIAGYAAAIKFNNFAVTSFSTLGNGMSNFTAQNLGASRPDRVRQGHSACRKMILVIACGFAAVYLFFGESIMQLFLDAENRAALEIGAQFFRIIAPFYIFVALKLSADGVLRGAGRMGEFMVGTFADLLLRVAFAFALSGWMGLDGVWWSWPLGWVVGAAMSILYYRRGRWAA